MKHSIVVMSITLILLACADQGTEVVQYYGTGDVSRRYTEIDGKKHGVMTDFYAEGQVLATRYFEHDVQVGKSTFFYPDGKIQEVQYYDQGKMHGGDTSYYENGQPKFLRTYNHGKLEGYVKKWAEDGTLIFEARYENDQPVEVKGEMLKTDSSLVRHAIDTMPRKK